MDKTIVRTGPHESSWAVRADMMEIDPQQLFARDLLVGKAEMPFDAATAYVKKIGVTASAELKVLLQRSPDPVQAFRDFESALKAE